MMLASHAERPAGQGDDEPTSVPPRTTMLRVLVVDDHRSYAEAVATALSLRLTAATVDHVHSVATARGYLAVNQVDALVLDWQLGDDDGIEFAREVAQRPDPPRIVMLTAHHSPALTRLAIHVGAQVALPKHATIASIADAIERDDADHLQRAATVPPTPNRVLTARQVEVLWLLSTGADVRTVANRLYLSVETVRSYVKDALRRLGAHNQLEAVAIARRNGLIPAEPVRGPTPPSA